MASNMRFSPRSHKNFLAARFLEFPKQFEMRKKISQLFGQWWDGTSSHAQLRSKLLTRFHAVALGGYRVLQPRER
jgi:hypothetical protein